jgi:cyclase
MQITEIEPDVFACLMENETANAGFVVTGRGGIVVDTLDRPGRGHQLAAALDGITGQPFLFVINTHHHYDHVFGNQAFDAPVVAHASLADQLDRAIARDLSPVAMAAWISVHPEDRWLAEELEIVYPNILFERRLVLDLPPRQLVVHHLGGHTPDSSIVDLPDEGILFAGDLVFEGRVPFLRHAHIEGTVRALRFLEGLGERVIVPGHGDLCDVGYLGRFRSYLEALQDRVATMIARGWEKGEVLDSDQLPRWWTEDRPELLRANVARVYDELREDLAPA